MRYSYDAMGRIISFIDAEGNRTIFAYDALGNLVSITNANGHTTTFTYDALNRMIRKTYPDGSSYEYAYDALGNKVSQTDPNGNTINYAYDRLGKLVQKWFPDGTTTDYSYDSLGELLTASNQDSTISYAYDKLGRIVSSNQNGKIINYAYDAAGNRVSMTTPEGEVIQYNYNANNLMTRIELSNGKGVSYSYDSLGRVIRRDYLGGIFANLSYDNRGRLIDLEYKTSDGNSIYAQTNLFDDINNILQKQTETGITIFGYDKTYQLTTADYPVLPDEQYSYDPVGNRLTSAEFNDWTYNNRNELSGYDGITLSYDYNGNTIAKADSNGTTTYHYDYENRMIGVDLPGGGTATYKYDALGRRIEKNVNGIVTRFLWDGNRLLAEYDASDNLVRNYFSGFGEINPSMMTESGWVYFYVKDHLDTPQKVIDENGDVKWSGEYTAFGKVTVNVNNVMNRFRFPGQYFDEETGLYYNVFRYYDAVLGRYLTEDPIYNHNLYTYVSNKPINRIDPLGLVSMGMPLDPSNVNGPKIAFNFFKKQKGLLR